MSMEKATSSYYRKDRSKKDDKQVTMYFNCNRSGTYLPKQERVRRIKSQGSRKMNRTCPAKLIVTKKNCNDTINVYFIPTHIGHQIDLKHLNLHKEDRLRIAQNLEQGVDRGQLLSKIKESIGASGSRLNLLTVKDLRNIKERCSKLLLSDISSHSSTHSSDLSSNSQSISSEKSSQVDIMIDGEINMEDASAEFFDLHAPLEYDNRRKLVDDIMDSLNVELPMETLNNIKELINSSRKPVVDMGVPIQYTKNRSSQQINSSNQESSSNLIMSQTVNANLVRQRRILPKIPESTKTSVSPDDLSQVKSIEKHLIQLKPVSELDTSQNGTIKLQLIDDTIDSSSLQLLPEICYVIIPPTAK